MSNIAEEKVVCPYCGKSIMLHYRQKLPDFEVWVAPIEDKV